MFAPYSPEKHGEPAAVVVRAAAASDAAAIATIYCARHGEDAAEVTAAVGRHLSAIADGRAPDRVFVASIDGVTVGYGKCGRRDYSGTGAADGWYLLGIVVSERHRRCGVGRALTAARLAWLAAQGATDCWYFTNVRNPASVAMHDEFGFTEVTRDFVIPKITVPGGSILLRCRLSG